MIRTDINTVTMFQIRMNVGLNEFRMSVRWSKLKVVDEVSVGTDVAGCRNKFGVRKETTWDT